uniref:Uncharacterized protein n=1 Tax=Leptobrachium leishanense TaxID=445787 RepID=A0A8C5QSQ5_9ANUR
GRSFHRTGASCEKSWSELIVHLEAEQAEVNYRPQWDLEEVLQSLDVSGHSGYSVNSNLLDASLLHFLYTLTHYIWHL